MTNHTDHEIAELRAQIVELQNKIATLEAARSATGPTASASAIHA